MKFYEITAPVNQEAVNQLFTRGKYPSLLRL